MIVLEKNLGLSFLVQKKVAKVDSKGGFSSFMKN